MGSRETEREEAELKVRERPGSLDLTPLWMAVSGDTIDTNYERDREGRQEFASRV